MVIKVEAVYDGTVNNLNYDSQKKCWTKEIKAETKELKKQEKISYHPVLLRIYDDAGNITIKTVSDAEFGDNLLLIVREEELFPMCFIVADESGTELGYVETAMSIDMDLNDKNDFAIEFFLEEWDESIYNFGHRIFIPGTEYGGLLEDRSTSTKKYAIEWRGYTWRGLLGQKIIEPPEGQEHLTVSGDANVIIRNIIKGRFGDLMAADNVDSGIVISNYQFDRYTTILEGLEKMLGKYNARLKIAYMRGERIERGRVVLSAVHVVDWSNDLKCDSKNGLEFTTRDYRCGINHLICAGQGEGNDRLALHLFAQKDGSIGDIQYYYGLDERTALYSYTSQDDVQKLREDGNKRLKELMNYKKINIDVDDIDVDIGDVISGIDEITGMKEKTRITGKILRETGGKITIEYKTKDGDNDGI